MVWRALAGGGFCCGAEGGVDVGLRTTGACAAVLGTNGWFGGLPADANAIALLSVLHEEEACFVKW